jgi:hypothetical protein
MKESVALLFSIVLIALGWDQSYQQQYVAITQSVTALKAGHLPVVLAPPPTPAPIAAVATPPPNDHSWMWQRSSLDSNKQSGVDRSGVHTIEPMVHAQ